MFDIGWPELVVIALVTILVMGPREIPRVLRTVQGLIRKIRGFTTEFRNSMDDLVREADLQDIREQAQKLSRMRPDQHLRDAIDPTGEIDASVRELSREMEQTGEEMAPDIAPPPVIGNPAEKKTAPATSHQPSAAAEPPRKPEGNKA